MNTQVDSSTIQKSLSDMKQSIHHAEIDLKTCRHRSEPNDRIVDVMEPFVKEAKARYETLEYMFNKMNGAYKELADYFAFEVNKYSLGEFFADLRTFSQQFKQCSQENAKMKEAEEKQKRADEERQQREQEKLANKCKKERLMQTNRGDGDDGGTGVMDNLLEALQSGKFFDSSPLSASGGAGRGRRPPRDGRRELGMFFLRIYFVTFLEYLAN